jgi:hypothetical protein
VGSVIFQKILQGDARFISTRRKVLKSNWSDASRAFCKPVPNANGNQTAEYVIYSFLPIGIEIDFWDNKYDSINFNGSQYLIKWGHVVSFPNQPTPINEPKPRIEIIDGLTFNLYKNQNCVNPKLYGLFDGVLDNNDVHNQDSEFLKSETVKIFTEIFILNEDIFILVMTKKRNKAAVWIAKFSDPVKYYFLCSTGCLTPP